MDERRETVTTPEGRRLEVRIAGPEGGPTVVAHPGTPDDARLKSDIRSAGAERRVRHVSYARPGYLESDRHEGRSVASCAADVRAIADALDIDRFHVVGWSGGGPHALACASLLRDRVISAATVAGAAPHDGLGLDWSAGMGDENVEELGLAEQGADQLLPFLEREAEEIRGSTPEDLLRILGDLVSEPDRAFLSGDYAEESLAGLQNALSNGVLGWLDDDLAFIRPWGFDLDSISVPVSIWQGREDRFVPITHGEWLAEHVRRARSHLLENEGHISVSRHRYGDVLDELLAQSRAVS
jgi:pimeloyl-ACP methyl ester carboxylesterase